MNDVPAGTSTAPAPEISASIEQADRDLIFDHWPCIAAVAWTGWLTAGAGFVGLAVGDDGVEIGYVAGSPCRCHPIGRSTYAPHEQVVVVVRRGGEQSLPMILGGRPAPPEAYAAMPAEALQETVH
jgi:hypothetical protein